jgi:protein-disulfide isomerase
MRIERERQVKRQRIRRQLFAGAGVAGVLIAATSIAVFVRTHGDAEASADTPLIKPAHASGKDGTTVVLGEAKDTLDLYEDPRCPVCADFEQNVGGEVLKGYRDGRYRLSFTFGTFLDGMAGGSGSHKALGALGAALDVSPDAFLDYHAQLYAKGNHPSEHEDKFSNVSYLLKVAERVPALKDNAKFKAAVKEGAFAGWANRMSAKFNASKVAGTPTLKYNGRTVAVSNGTAPMTPQDFTRALNSVARKPSA